MLVSTSILGGHVDTIGSKDVPGRRRRRLHSDEFKADAIAAAAQPGISRRPWREPAVSTQIYFAAGFAKRRYFRSRLFRTPHRRHQPHPGTASASLVASLLVAANRKRLAVPS
jgi:hypothetical protein